MEIHHVGHLVKTKGWRDGRVLLRACFSSGEICRVPCRRHSPGTQRRFSAGFIFGLTVVTEAAAVPDGALTATSGSPGTPILSAHSTAPCQGHPAVPAGTVPKSPLVSAGGTEGWHLWKLFREVLIYCGWPKSACQMVGKSLPEGRSGEARRCQGGEGWRLEDGEDRGASTIDSCFLPRAWHRPKGRAALQFLW